MWFVSLVSLINLVVVFMNLLVLSFFMKFCDLVSKIWSKIGLMSDLRSKILRSINLA